MTEKRDAAQEVVMEASIQRDLKDDYRKVFVGSKEGRRVLTDLLQHCGVLRQVIDLDSQVQTAFNAGQQSVGLLLMDLVDKRGYDAIIEMEKLGAELTKIGEEDT